MRFNVMQNMIERLATRSAVSSSARLCERAISVIRSTAKVKVVKTDDKKDAGPMTDSRERAEDEHQGECQGQHKPPEMRERNRWQNDRGQHEKPQENEALPGPR